MRQLAALLDQTRGFGDRGHPSRRPEGRRSERRWPACRSRTAAARLPDRHGAAGRPRTTRRATVRAIQRGEIDAVVVVRERPTIRRSCCSALLAGAIACSWSTCATARSRYPSTARSCTRIHDSPQMLGVSPNAIVGTRLADFLEDRDRPLLDAFLDGRRGAGSQVEVTCAAEDGAVFQALLTPCPRPTSTAFR